jgi:hypothetical protein
MTSLPVLAVELSRVLLDEIHGLSKKIAELEKTTVREATRGATLSRLQTMPGLWDRSQRWRLRLSRRRSPSSNAAATLPLGWACSPATFDGRQAASRQEPFDGPHPAPVDYRRVRSPTSGNKEFIVSFKNV